MTRSNRVLNRAILAVLGLLALAVGAVVAALAVDPARFPGLDDRLGAAIALVRSAIAGVVVTPLLLWSIAAACALVVVLALAWILTRGRGRMSTPVAAEGVEIDIRVVQQVLQHELRSALDVVGVHAVAYRDRRDPIVRVRLDVRRGADLVRLMTAVDAAVERLDATLGTEPRILVHITTGLRTALSREHRAA